jgi:signal transduction histidine kinase
MSSLRVRLLLATVLVAAVAVLATALLSRRVVTGELSRYVFSRETVDLVPVSRALDQHRLRTGSFAGSDPVLARFAGELGRGLLVTDLDGRVIAASAPLFRNARVENAPDGQLRILAGAGMVLELKTPPQAVLYGAPGKPAARLITTPEPDRRTSPATPPLLRRVDRGLWLAALIAIALGAVLMGFLTTRMTGPIAALTAAARRMQSGDLTPRVAVRGNDEIAALASSFNAMADALQQSTAQRRQLTHDVAHELRSPLTNLRAQVEALQDGLLTPNAAALASLHEEVTLLARLIDDLQQLADAESGTLRLATGPVAVRDALAGAAAGFQARAGDLGIELVVDAPADVTAQADAVRLGQVLRNLLDNAFAHTSRGGRVRLAARPVGPRVEFAVEDSGTGIAREHLPHVFERLYRADPSRSRATGGAGLGLAIVKQLVERQGGTVGATSEPGRGTRIFFTLPAA